MVVVLHTTDSRWIDFGDPRHISGIFLNGASGVDLFFIISGFVMTVTATGPRLQSPGNFFTRRILRIAPLYWIVTILTAGELLLVMLRPALGGNHAHAQLSIHYLLASLLFIPAHSTRGAIEPIVNVGWTLNYEMFFYVLFAIALLWRRRALTVLIPLITALALLGLTHYPKTPLRPHWPAFTSLADPILLEFLAGILLGLLVQSRFRIPNALAALCGLLGLAGLLTLPLTRVLASRELSWGIPAFLLVFAAVMLERDYGRRLPAWLLRIGDSSYSLYLLHQLVILAVARLFLHFHHSPGSVLFTILATIPSLFVAHWSYRLIERPLTLRLSRQIAVPPPPIVFGAAKKTQLP